MIFSITYRIRQKKVNPLSIAVKAEWMICKVRCATLKVRIRIFKRNKAHWLRGSKNWWKSDRHIFLKSGWNKSDRRTTVRPKDFFLCLRIHSFDHFYLNWSISSYLDYSIRFVFEGNNILWQTDRPTDGLTKPLVDVDASKNSMRNKFLQCFNWGINECCQALLSQEMVKFFMIVRYFMVKTKKMMAKMDISMQAKDFSAEWIYVNFLLIEIAYNGFVKRFIVWYVWNIIKTVGGKFLRSFKNTIISEILAECLLSGFPTKWWSSRQLYCKPVINWQYCK